MSIIPKFKRCLIDGTVLPEDSEETSFLTELSAGTWIEFTNKINDPEWAEKEFYIHLWKTYMVLLHTVEDGIPSVLVEINNVNEKRQDAREKQPQNPEEEGTPVPPDIHWLGSVYHALKGMSTQDFYDLQESFRARVPWEWIKEAYTAVDSMLTPVSQETKDALKKD